MTSSTIMSLMPSWWVAASVALAVLSLGLSGILKLAASILLVVSGCLAVLYAVTAALHDQERASVASTSSSRQEWRHHLVHRGRRQRRSGRRRDSKSSSPPPPPMDSQLTGVPLIDEQLHLIISYLMRDHVHSWQSGLTHDNEFPQRVQRTLQTAIASLSDRVRRVDWIPFLTTRYIQYYIFDVLMRAAEVVTRLHEFCHRLVDDVASHVRLFKRARLLQKTKNVGETGGGKVSQDLESLFFDAEVAMEDGQVCRDLVCTIHQEEINYLQVSTNDHFD